MPNVRTSVASAHARRYHFRQHVGRRGLSEIADAWRELAGSLPRRWFHHLPEWYECYFDALESDEASVRFYAAYDGARLVAIVPLKTTPLRVMGRQIAVLTLPYHDHVPFCDIICDPTTDVASIGVELLRHLRRDAIPRWDLLVLPRVLDGAAAGKLVGAARPSRVVRHRQGHCDFLPCAGARTTRDLVSGKLIRDLRRRGNKLRQEGEVTFAVAYDGPEVMDAFDEFLTVEASGWKGAHGAGTAIALHPELVRFYHAILERFAPLGSCEVSQLLLNGRCVAAQFSLLIDGAWYLLKMGYDESLSKAAPGNLLVEHALDRLCASDAVREANLVSDAAWHGSWSPQSCEVNTYFVANLTLRGLVAVALLRLKERANVRRAAADSTRGGAAGPDDRDTPQHASAAVASRQPAGRV